MDFPKLRDNQGLTPTVNDETAQGPFQLPFKLDELHLADAFEKLKGLLRPGSRVEEPTLEPSAPQNAAGTNASAETGQKTKTAAVISLPIPSAAAEVQFLDRNTVFLSLSSEDKANIIGLFNAKSENPKFETHLLTHGERETANFTAYQSKTLPIALIEIIDVTVSNVPSLPTTNVKIYTVTTTTGETFRFLESTPNPKYDPNIVMPVEPFKGAVQSQITFTAISAEKKAQIAYGYNSAEEAILTTWKLDTPTTDSTKIITEDGESRSKMFARTSTDEPWVNPLTEYWIDAPNDVGAKKEDTMPVQTVIPESSAKTTNPERTVISRTPNVLFVLPAVNQENDVTAIWNRFDPQAQAVIKNNDALSIAWQTLQWAYSQEFLKLAALKSGDIIKIANMSFSVSNTSPLTLTPPVDAKFTNEIRILYNLNPSSEKQSIRVQIVSTTPGSVGEVVANAYGSWAFANGAKSNFQLTTEVEDIAENTAYEYVGYFSQDLAETDYWVVSSPNTQGFATLWLNGKTKNKNFKNENWTNIQLRFMLNSPNYKSSIRWEDGLGNTWENSDSDVEQTTIGRGSKAKETKSKPARTEKPMVGLVSGPVVSIGARIGLNSTTTDATSDFKNYPEDSSSQGLGVSAQALVRGGYFFTPNLGVLGEVALGYNLRQSAFVEYSVSSDWNAYAAARFGVWQFGLGGGISPQYALKREGAVTTPQGYTITSPEYLSAWSNSPQAAAFASWRILTLGVEYEFSSTNVAEDTQYITGLRTSNINVWAGVTVPLK